MGWAGQVVGTVNCWPHLSMYVEFSNAVSVFVSNAKRSAKQAAGSQS